MGQKSLPRLHKLDSGLVWEASYLNTTELWQSVKLYVLLVKFAHIFVKKQWLYYKFNWYTTNYNNFYCMNISNQIHNKQLLTYNSIFTTKSLLTNFIFLNLYLIYIQNSYYLLLLIFPLPKFKNQYTKKKLQKQFFRSQMLKNQISKKKINLLTITKSQPEIFFNIFLNS